MADEGNADTFEYTIAGRVMVFKKTTPSQLMMMQRLVRRVQQQMHAVAGQPEKVAELVAQLNDMMFEAVESRFVDPLDILVVHTEILRGNVTEEHLMPILSNGNSRAEQPDDDADPVPAKRTRKAAAAKKAPGKPASRRAAR